MIEVIKKGLETSVQDYPGRIGSLNQGFQPQVLWIVGLLDWQIY